MVWAITFPNLLTNSPFLNTALGLEYWEEKLAQQLLSVHNKLSHLACAQPASDFPQDLFEEAKRRPAPHLPLQAASVSAHYGASSQSSPASSPLCSRVDQSTPRILYMPLSVRDVSFLIQFRYSSPGLLKLTAQTVCDLMHFKV